MAVEEHAKVTIDANTGRARDQLGRFAKSAQEAERSVGQGLAGALKSADKSLLDFTSKLGNTATGLQSMIGLVKGVHDGMIAMGREAVNQQNVFANLTIGIDGARAATNNMVSDFELAKAANNALSLGVVENAEQFAELAEIATALGARVGQDATKSVEDLTVALGRSSPMILDNLGLTVKVGAANEKYAQRLGKTVNQLSDAEKKEAFKAAAMEAGMKAIQGVEVATDSLAVKTQQLAAAEANLATKAFGAGVGHKGLLQSIERLDDEMIDLLVEANQTGAAMEELKERLRAANISTDDLSKSTRGLARSLAIARREAIKLESARKAARKANEDDTAARQQSAKAAKEAGESIANLERQMEGLESGSKEMRQAEIDLAAQHLKLSEAMGDAEGVAHYTFALENLTPAQEDAGKAARGHAKEIASLNDLIEESIRMAREAERGAAEARNAAFDVLGQGERDTETELRREIEIRRAHGLEVSQLEDQLLQARLDRVALQEQIGLDHESGEELRHQRQVARIQERIEREKAAARERERLAREAQRRADEEARRQKALLNVTQQTTQGTIGVLANANTAFNANAEQQAKIANALRGTQLAVDAGFYFAKSAAAFAALNPLQGAANAAAGVISSANAAIAFAGNLQSKGRAGGASAGGGGGFQTGVTRSDRGDAVDAPLSPLEESADRNSPVPGGGAGGGGGSVVYNFNGAILDDEKLLRAVRDAERRTGRFGA